MAKKQNLLNKTFTYLTVVEELNERTKNGDVIWICQCKCGKSIKVGTRKLNSKHVKSCGCILKDSMEKRMDVYYKEKNINPYLNLKVHSVKHNAKSSKKSFELTNENVCYITTQPCYYCGSLEIEEGLLRRYTGKNCWVTPTNGIDRINSEIGYINSNVRPCCSKCNYAKRTLDEDEFYSHIECVYKHLVKIGRISSG